MEPEPEVTAIVAPQGPTVDMTATLWAVRRFVPGASDATLQYINPYASLQPRPDILLINLPPYAKRGAIMPTPSPDGGPGSCLRTVVDRYCPDGTRQATEPFVLAVENSMRADVGVDPGEPVDLRNGDLAVVLRGFRRTFLGYTEWDDRTREAMSPVFDALYALLGIRS